MKVYFPRWLGSFLCLAVASARLHDPKENVGSVAKEPGRQLKKRFQGIRGGSEASGAEYPFFALIFDSTGFYYCGGSLIKDNVVLTAAHCISPNDLPFRVAIGGDTFEDGESINVVNTIVHPLYDATNNLAYDFAILELESASTAPTVTLNQDTEFPETAGTALKTIGYGVTETGEQSSFLKQVDLVYVEFETCQANNYPGIQEPLHECVDGADPDEGPCVGDSGGPLLYEGTLAIGVLSFGAVCGTEGVDVYAKISDNYEWIAETAGLETTVPTIAPTAATGAPTAATGAPTTTGTTAPTTTGTTAPTTAGTEAPSTATTGPTQAPSVGTGEPTTTTTEAPIIAPTVAPTTGATTEAPTTAPTEAPTVPETDEPTAEPTEEPTEAPTISPAPTPEPIPMTSSLCSFANLWGGDPYICLGRRSGSG